MDTKALRQKILDLAIRGKLVPQDPNDEPASVLLERIRTEKQQMVKDGKLKAKDIKNDSVIFVGEDNLHYEKMPDGTVKCIEDEIPFELPDGWEWARLGVAFSHNTGKALNKSKTEGTMLTYITTSNLYWNRFELEQLKSMPFTDSEVEKCTVRKGDLLVCEGGDIGRAAIWNYDNEIRIQNHIHRLRAYIELNIEFFYHVFYLYKLTDMISGKGIGIQGLSSNQLHSIPMPLPPIQEQHRIVAKLNELISFIEAIESDKADLQTTIQLTKSKILDLAIRGKLVPQNPDDEPASILLDRIRAEKEELIKQGKIKRNKKESVIYKGDDNSYYEVIGKDAENIDDDIPYDIPDGWAWCRIKDICQMNAGKSKHKDQIFPEPFNNCFPCYGGNGHRGYVDTYNYEGKYSIVGRQGALCGNVNTAEGKFYATEHAVVVTLFDKVNFEWSFFTLKTLNLNQYATGAAQPGLSVANIQNVFIPVPPLSEQKRIADKVSRLFSLLDSIAENVN